MSEQKGTQKHVCTVLLLDDSPIGARVDGRLGGPERSGTTLDKICNYK